MSSVISADRLVISTWLILLPLIVAGCSRDPQAAKVRYVASAERYVAAGKLHEAIIEYRNAIERDPKASDVRVKLAETYLKAGDRGNALREFVRVADLVPEDRGAQIKAAEFLLLAGRFDDARARLEKVLAQDERDVDAQILFANALAGQKDLDGAIAELEEAVSLDPGRSATYSSLGLLEMERGQMEAAERALEQAIALDARSLPAHMSLATFYWRTGRASEAEGALKRALEVEPDSLAANRAMAIFSVATDRAAEAERYLKKVAAISKSREAELALADYYISRRQDASAAAILEPMQADPATASASLVRLASLDGARGERERAYERLGTVLAKDPANLRALVLKSALHLADGNAEAAVSAAREAVSKHGKSATAQFALGRAEAARSHTAEAIAAYAEVLRLNPRATAAKVALAQLHLAKGQADTSVLLAQEAVRAEPRNLRAQLLLVQGLLKRRDLERAEAELDNLLTRFPDSAMVHVQFGMLRTLQNSLNEAQHSFDRALALAPESIEALAGHVALDVAARRPDEARRRVDERLQRGSPGMPLLMLAARTYQAVGDPKGAEELLRRALALDAGYLPAYGALGQLYVRQRRLDAARAEFEALAARESRPVAALTMLGTILQTQQNTKAAREAYERALQLDPEAPVAANNLAWLIVTEGGNLDVALQLAQTAKRHLPDNPDVNDTLGFVYYKKDLHPLAIAALKQSVERDSDNPGYHSHLGLAYAKAGNADKARQHLRRALALDSRFEGAREASRVLQSLDVQ